MRPAMTLRCVICGEPTPGGRYCEACDDLAKLDPFAPMPVNLVLLRRMRVTLTRAIGIVDQIERRARETQT